MQAVPAATFVGGDAAEPTTVRARTRRAASKGKRRSAVLRVVRVFYEPRDACVR
jgi:hypothetical protein